MITDIIIAIFYIIIIFTLIFMKPDMQFNFGSTRLLAPGHLWQSLCLLVRLDWSCVNIIISINIINIEKNIYKYLFTLLYLILQSLSYTISLSLSPFPLDFEVADEPGVRPLLSFSHISFCSDEPGVIKVDYFFSFLIPFVIPKNFNLHRPPLHIFCRYLQDFWQISDADIFHWIFGKSTTS